MGIEAAFSASSCLAPQYSYLRFDKPPRTEYRCLPFDRVGAHRRVPSPNTLGSQTTSWGCNLEDAVYRTPKSMTAPLGIGDNGELMREAISSVARTAPSGVDSIDPQNARVSCPVIPPISEPSSDPFVLLGGPFSPSLFLPAMRHSTINLLSTTSLQYRRSLQICGSFDVALQPRLPEHGTYVLGSR